MMVRRCRSYCRTNALMIAKMKLKRLRISGGRLGSLAGRRCFNPVELWRDDLVSELERFRQHDEK